MTAARMSSTIHQRQQQGCYQYKIHKLFYPHVSYKKFIKKLRCC